MKDLEALYEEYFAKLYAYCLTLTHNAEEAEELTAESFSRAVIHYGKFRKESDIGTWLCSIARNCYFDQLRKRKRSARAACLVEWDDPFAQSEDRENVSRILVAMNKLEEPYRGVFLYRTVGGMDSAEIGRLYGKNANWAYIVFHRAKLKIIELMEDKP